MADHSRKSSNSDKVISSPTNIREDQYFMTIWDFYGATTAIISATRILASRVHAINFNDNCICVYHNYGIAIISHVDASIAKMVPNQRVNPSLARGNFPAANAPPERSSHRRERRGGKQARSRADPAFPCRCPDPFASGAGPGHISRLFRIEDAVL
ncbi:hypothetical protein [Sphingobium indicum]|uniref:hypothetical protein n=1 Tax=Sphingobium indicum TaxID=332055 RepID=UPI0018C8EBF4|nr:hypothetical protein [Sphingobium indicum]